MASLDVMSYNRQGKVFTLTNAAAASVLAVSTTMTGLILINPFGSGKKLVLVDAGFVWTTAGAAAHQIGVALGYSTTAVTNTTPVSVYAADGRGVATTSVAAGSNSATLPAAAVTQMWIGGSLGTAVSPYMVRERIDGSLIVIPGAYAHLTTVTTTAVGMGSFTWIEVPV